MTKLHRLVPRTGRALVRLALLATALLPAASPAQPMPPLTCQALSDLHGIVHEQGFGFARDDLQRHWRHEHCNTRPNPSLVPLLCQTFSDQLGLAAGEPARGPDREAAGSFRALGCNTRPLPFRDCQAMSDVYGVFFQRSFGMAPERIREAWQRVGCATQPQPAAYPTLCQQMSDRYQIISGRSFGYAERDVQLSWRAMSCTANPHRALGVYVAPPAGPGYEPPAPGPAYDPPAPGPAYDPPAPGPGYEPPAPGPGYSGPPGPGPGYEPPAGGYEPPPPGPGYEPPAPGPGYEPPPAANAVLLSRGKRASQSSRSEYSKPNDPEGAVDGIKNGGFGFHTQFEQSPWWQVDLGGMSRLAEVVIWNREDCCAERAAHIQVLLSEDGQSFHTVYAHDGRPFGGARDGRPLRVRLEGARARFVRLQLADRNALHLDEVEVYGTPLYSGQVVAPLPGEGPAYMPGARPPPQGPPVTVMPSVRPLPPQGPRVNVAPSVVGEDELAGILQAIGAEAYADGKERVMREATRTRWFTVDQLLRIFNQEGPDLDRPKTVEIFAPHLVDKRENGYKLYAELPFENDKRRVQQLLER